MDNQNSTKWTAKMVSAQMEEAARTLLALRVTGLKPMGFGNSWPDVVHDSNEAYSLDDEKSSRGPPLPDAITRMDESLQWLHWLEREQSRLVWLYANDVPRKKICALLGVSRMTAWRMWMAAIMTISAILNMNKKE